jgi:acetyltransferase-like isoleucine patch superfamily enzyme
VSDNLHTYEDVNVPVIKQGIKQCEEVEIGEGSWIGENVCVIGAKVGRHCVIGANAVVTEDIPDYSVAVGMPAKVIKKYNPEKGIWERI